MMESLPPGRLRDQALDRIRSLDCANADTALVPCGTGPSLFELPDASQKSLGDARVDDAAPAAAWQKSLEDARMDDATYAKAIAAALKSLACSGRDDAVYVLRGLLRDSPPFHSRLAAAGPEAPALIDFIINKDCPVSASLTDDDKADLLRIKQDAIKKPGG